MAPVRPIYKKLLIAAAAVFVIGCAWMLSDLYARVANVEHRLAHLLEDHRH